MDSVPFEKVQQIVHLLSAVAGMNAPINQRRQTLAEGVVKLIDADIWVWIHSRYDPATRFPSAFSALDGGWNDDAERSAFLTALHNEELNDATAHTFLGKTHQTFIRQEFLPENDPRCGRLLQQWSAATGLRECILSCYPLAANTISGIGLHRRIGKPEFTDDDRALVHLIFSAVPWLHSVGADVRGNDDRLLQLSAREREVLIYLLQGGPRKQIAERLNISHHTIADHTKAIYKCFGVNSRAKLLALFMGNTGSPGTPPNSSDAANG